MKQPLRHKKTFKVQKDMNTNFNKTNMTMRKYISLGGLRAVLMVLLIAFGVENAWGINTTKFYSSAGAKSMDTAKGKVYVGKSAATSSTTYADEMTTYDSKSESSVGSTANSTNQFKFYYAAKAESGYVFLGWKKSTSDADYACETETFTEENYEESNKTEIKSNPAFTNCKRKYYAYFGTGKITLEKDVVAFDKSGSGSFSITYVTGGAITISSSSSDFEISPASIPAGKGTQTVTITYKGAGTEVARTLITISSSGVESQYIDASALTGTITSSNAASIVLQTGTVNNSTSHPYHPIENLDLTACFAGNAASFDELYLFGKTLNKTNLASTSLNINTAVTPCYVYTKSGNNYVFSTVVNMNSETKGIGVNKSSGKKYYFSGWCPYASMGYQSSDIGVFHISGAAGATADIYLYNAYIYARTKFNGHADLDYVANTSNSSYPSGSGGVFVLQTSSTSSSNPFKPSIHLRGSNFLRSNQGSFIKVEILGNSRTANQCSAPIHMYTTSTSQCETLTIDDIWPVASGTERTNGALKLDKAVNQAPSIDLGNSKSVVNFNGGRITLRNAIPGSANYTTAFAISWRSYSASGATVYGLGNDQTGGTVNFNDGTIDVTPLTDNEYSTNSTYYRDKKSIKCPSTAYINGGSYNCSIWKCTEPADLGASPQDKSGTALCKLSLQKTGVDPKGFAIFEIPAVFKKGLDAYYEEKDWTYGVNSIAADEEDNVNLMLPCDLIDESAIINVQVDPWVGILPYFRAGAMGQYVYFGGDQTIASDENHTTDRLLYGRMDDYVDAIISSYSPPDVDAGVTLMSPDYNKNALNESSYTISSNTYILLPIVADQWFAFAAPFDVVKVSVFDAYPDELVQEDININTSLSKQATSNMDLFYYIGSSMQGGGQTNISAMVSAWVNAQKTLRYDEKTDAIKNQFKQRELLPYTSASAASDKNHFWLYENANSWTYNGKNFTGQTLVTGKTDGLVMQKNKVYSMMFSSENVATGDWKYWTGKYILIEGGENCEIAGTSSQPSTSESYTSTTAAAIKGNHTLADIAAPASLGAFWGYDYSSGTYKHLASKTNPTQAFLYTQAVPNDGTPASITAIRANGICEYLINYSGANLSVLAAEEYGTYSPEGEATVKYFYKSGNWNKLTFAFQSGDIDFYQCAEDNLYYWYNESSNAWELAVYTVTITATPTGYGSVSTSSIANVPYGTTVSTSNNTLTITGKTTVTATPAVETAEYTYGFDNWSNVPETVTGDVTITANFTRANQSYALTWDANGGTISGEYTHGTTAYSTQIIAPVNENVTRTGYTFEGWSDGTSIVTPAQTMPAANTTYTAQWSAITYAITYDLGGGHVATANPTSYTIESEPITLNNPTRAGYNFVGWTGSSLSEATQEVTIAHGSTGDRAYAAQYELPQEIIASNGDEVEISSTATSTTTTVEVGGTVTIAKNKKLTTDNLILEASADGSGEILGEGTLEVTGNAYFDLTLNTDDWHWTSFGVPFEISLDDAPLLKGKTTPLVLGTDYDIVYYNTNTRASRGPIRQCWEYVEYQTERKLIPGRAYLIAFNHGIGHVDVVRFTKASSAPLYTDEDVAVVTTGYGTNDNWNGIANPRMFHALLDDGVTECQVHNGGAIGDDGYTPYDMEDKKFFVGKAAFVQVPNGKSEIAVTPADDKNPITVKAPRREQTQTRVKPYDVQIAPIDGEMQDRIFIQMEDGKADEYVILSDLVKAGVSTTRAQMWVERYGVKLCKNTVSSLKNSATYPLNISIPQDGEYEISVQNVNNQTSDMIYLTYDGRMIWNLTYAPYAAMLETGINTHYGLKLVRSNTPTDIEQTSAVNDYPQIQKIIMDDKVYILRGGEMFTVTGQKAQ